MKRLVLSALLLVVLAESVRAQAPKAQEVPAKTPASLSLGRKAVMEVPAGQNLRRIAPDGAVITSRWEISGGEVPTNYFAEGTVTFTLHYPEEGDSTQLPFSPSVPKSKYERVTEVRVDGPYVSFTDVRDPDIAIYNRNTGKVRRITHPGGGLVVDVSVSAQTGDVLYERREGRTTKPRVYLWRRGESEPTLISDRDTFTPQWAPSGNLFLLRKGMSAQETNSGDDGSYLYWWIYSSDGKPLLDLSRYGRPSQADWSPDSRKLALDVRSDPRGLFILYLGGNSQSVDVERARYIVAPEGKHLDTPKWSPDGTSLAYTAWYIGDQSGQRTELRLLEDESYRRYSAGPGSASTFIADPWTWTSPLTLTVAGEATSHTPGPTGRMVTRVTINF